MRIKLVTVSLNSKTWSTKRVTVCRDNELNEIKILLSVTRSMFNYVSYLFSIDINATYVPVIKVLNYQLPLISVLHSSYVTLLYLHHDKMWISRKMTCHYVKYEDIFMRDKNSSSLK